MEKILDANQGWVLLNIPRIIQNQFKTLCLLVASGFSAVIPEATGNQSSNTKYMYAACMHSVCISHMIYI